MAGGIGETVFEINWRLGEGWQDLAMYLELGQQEQRRFKDGHEFYGMWHWLEGRHRLGELPDALRQIGRPDLAELLVHASLGSTTEQTSETIGKRRAKKPGRRITLLLLGSVTAVFASYLTFESCGIGETSARSGASSSASHIHESSTVFTAPNNSPRISYPVVRIIEPTQNAEVKPCTTVTFSSTSPPVDMAFALGLSIPEHNAWHFTADLVQIRPGVWSKTQSLGDSTYGKGAPFVINVYLFREGELDALSKNRTEPWDPDVPPTDATKLASVSVHRNAYDLGC